MACHSVILEIYLLFVRRMTCPAYVHFCHLIVVKVFSTLICLYGSDERIYRWTPANMNMNTNMKKTKVMFNSPILDICLHSVTSQPPVPLPWPLVCTLYSWSTTNLPLSPPGSFSLPSTISFLSRGESKIRFLQVLSLPSTAYHWIPAYFHPS